MIFFGIMFFPLFAQETVFNYEMKKGNISFFDSILISLLHDGLVNQYQLEYGGNSFETYPYQDQSSSEQDQRVSYFFSSEVDFPIKEVFEQYFIQFKQLLNNASIEGVLAMIKMELSKEIYAQYFQEKEKMLAIIHQISLEDFQLKKEIFFSQIEFSIRDISGKNFSQNAHFIFQEAKPICFKPIDYEEIPFVIEASDKDKKIIRNLIAELGSKSLISLLAKRSEMNKMGDQIRHVPPMDFLAVVFTSKEHKEHMKSIKKSYFKWNSIIDEVGSNMGREKKKPGLERRVYAFASFMKVDANVLFQKIDHEDWAGFVTTLF